jgi:hypothetical protein
MRPQGVVISSPLVTKRNVSILAIVLMFIGMSVWSVVDQSAGAGFIIVLALFSVIVIALGPWVFGN